MVLTVSLIAGDGFSIEIPPGQTILGRGDLLRIYDKRLSRNQASIEVTDDEIFVVAMGVNPTYLTRRGEKARPMKKNKKYAVNNGDFFTLLTDMFPFTVRVKGGQKQSSTTTTAPKNTAENKVPKDEPKKQKDEPKNQQKDEPKNQQKDEDEPKKQQKVEDEHKKQKLVEDTKKQQKLAEEPQKQHNQPMYKEPTKVVSKSSSFAQQANKRKYDDSDDDWGSGSEDEKNKKHKVNPQPQQKKQDAPAKQKPYCQYGKKCYRQNPSHWDEFSHTPPSSPKTDFSLMYDDIDDEMFADLENMKKKPTDITKNVVSNNSNSQGKSDSMKQKSSNESGPHSEGECSDKEPLSVAPPNKSSKSVQISKQSDSKPKNTKKPSGKWSLAFPLISTTSYMFDTKEAIKVFCNSLASFHEKHPQLDVDLICVVEPDRELDVRAEFERILSEKDMRVDVTSKNIIETGARILANDSNWRLKEEPRHKQLYAAAGSLDADTKAKYPKPGFVGGVFPVPLPTNSSLHEQGIEWVVHCVGPNMNKQKPDCLSSYTEASPLLQKVFDGLFECIYQLSEGQNV